MAGYSDFRVHIGLGNDAMLTSQDVALALRSVAGRLDDGQTNGVVTDANGNTVGTFEFEASDA